LSAWEHGLFVWRLFFLWDCKPNTSTHPKANIINHLEPDPRTFPKPPTINHLEPNTFTDRSMLRLV
jgi:hypothetical protein